MNAQLELCSAFCLCGVMGVFNVVYTGYVEETTTTTTTMISAAKQISIRNRRRASPSSPKLPSGAAIIRFVRFGRLSRAFAPCLCCVGKQKSCKKVLIMHDGSVCDVGVSVYVYVCVFACMVLSD